MTVRDVPQGPADQLLLLRVKVLEGVVHPAEDDQGHGEHLHGPGVHVVGPQPRCLLPGESLGYPELLGLLRPQRGRDILLDRGQERGQGAPDQLGLGEVDNDEDGGVGQLGSHQGRLNQVGVHCTAPELPQVAHVLHETDIRVSCNYIAIGLNMLLMLRSTKACLGKYQLAADALCDEQFFYAKLSILSNFYFL